jgi:hypothetical protein
VNWPGAAHNQPTSEVGFIAAEAWVTRCGIAFVDGNRVYEFKLGAVSKEDLARGVPWRPWLSVAVHDWHRQDGAQLACQERDGTVRLGTDCAPVGDDVAPFDVEAAYGNGVVSGLTPPAWWLGLRWRGSQAVASERTSDQASVVEYSVSDTLGGQWHVRIFTLRGDVNPGSACLRMDCSSSAEAVEHVLVATHPEPGVTVVATGAPAGVSAGDDLTPTDDLIKDVRANLAVIETPRGR